MAARHPEQAHHRLFGDVNQTGRGAHPAAFAQMVNNRHLLFLWDLRVEQGGPAALGALLAARPAVQEPKTSLAVDFAHGEIVLTDETKPLACRIGTHESVEVGALHEVLL